MRSSFKYEIRLKNEVLNKISARKGIVLPIEDRIIKSIDRAFESAGLNSDDMKNLGKGEWSRKNLFSKAKELGMDKVYLGAFTGPSQAVHGSWGDIYAHCLTASDDLSFTPNMEWNYPRPQLISTAAGLVILALYDFFGFICSIELQENIYKFLADLEGRISNLQLAHENYLAPKQWPNI